MVKLNFTNLMSTPITDINTLINNSSDMKSRMEIPTLDTQAIFCRDLQDEGRAKFGVECLQKEEVVKLVYFKMGKYSKRRESTFLRKS